MSGIASGVVSGIAHFGENCGVSQSSNHSPVPACRCVRGRVRLAETTFQKAAARKRSDPAEYSIRFATANSRNHRGKAGKGRRVAAGLFARTSRRGARGRCHRRGHHHRNAGRRADNLEYLRRRRRDDRRAHHSSRTARPDPSIRNLPDCAQRKHCKEYTRTAVMPRGDLCN